MKGLKLTEIESHGFKLYFKRFMLTEHPVLPKASLAPHHINWIGNYDWYDGEIIGVYWSRRKAEKAFGNLARNYVVTDVDYY